MAIDLYLMTFSGPCRTVIMTANHLGIKLNYKYIDLFMKKDHLKPQFLRMNPLHSIPVIDDNGFYLWESRVIQTYLVDKYFPDHPIYPKDPEKRAAIDRVLFFDVGTLTQASDRYLRHQWYKGEPEDPEKLKIFKNALDTFENLLGKTTYAAANHITIADFSLIANLCYTQMVNFKFTGYPRITAWMERLAREIPDYKEINDIPIQKFKEEYIKSNGPLPPELF